MNEMINEMNWHDEMKLMNEWWNEWTELYLKLN